MTYVKEPCYNSLQERWRDIIIWYFLYILIVITLIIMVGISFYKVNQKRKDKKHIKLTNRWREYLGFVLTDENAEDLKMQQKHYNKLHSVEELMAFYTALLEYKDSAQMKENGEFRQFIRENKSLWVSLGHVYAKKRPIEKAYFAFICEQLCINTPEEYDEMTKIMQEYAQEPSIYCRENALKALYAFGNIDAVVEVFIKLSRNNSINHRKLVTDGLLEFKGDQIALAESLYNHLDQFKSEYQVAMVDFFRFSGEPLKNKLIKILKQGDADKDLVCAILRYYAKYPVQEYKDTILSYLTIPNEKDWECVSAAALALGKYPGEDTIHALKSVLSSKYWYVRLNAARSIVELDTEEAELMDILEGQDSYAKEQLIYHIKNRKELRLQNG
ncbi:HEAT repeat domain-containing protein [Cytobacillus gottheilii]|uniref:HEAT repeat domain-containing protein n=1 Tax=Cytobacillus gottheilii TaxID=859144 RepID=UPI003CF10D35